MLSQRDTQRPLQWLCFYTFVDIACALTVAMMINTALLIVAAATFNSTGASVLTLQVYPAVMPVVILLQSTPMQHRTPTT